MEKKQNQTNISTTVTFRQKNINMSVNGKNVTLDTSPKST